ncbi:MAG TPA: hypothetical protein VH575_32480 [Gemmataceae bacterium]|jgi:hypothetical protein
MHDIFSREPDPLEGMLRPRSVPPQSEALRQAVYARTRGVLRRRRLVRQLAYVAALLVSFGAGLLVMRVTIPRADGERGRVSAPSAQTPNTQTSSTQALGALTRPRSPALVKEWNAFDSDGRRNELYRQAGDSYMEEEHDPQSALRCYTNALDHGTKQDLTISADDNWLLMAIKGARQKENNYAKTGS